MADILTKEIDKLCVEMEIKFGGMDVAVRHHGAFDFRMWIGSNQLVFRGVNTHDEDLIDHILRAIRSHIEMERGLGF